MMISSSLCYFLLVQETGNLQWWDANSLYVVPRQHPAGPQDVNQVAVLGLASLICTSDCSSSSA
jgi:hypothetical protein